MSDPADYTVGWICAVGKELVAALAFLDEHHDPPDHIPITDNNTYTLGLIGKHKVVIAAMPHRQYGLVSASTAARDMVGSFPNVRIGLMVGIGGGAPSRKHDIRLGDVVVSSPGIGSGGVLQYDYGKTIQDEQFSIGGYLNQPPQFMLTALSVLDAHYESEGHDINGMINGVLARKPRIRAKYGRPEPDTDRLYKSSFKHVASDGIDCEEACGTDELKLVSRMERPKEENNPAIHYGLIASANQLMKDAQMRDKLSAANDVLCFEMEAAGLMNHFPCLVIRGICDYSDTHKNDKWQGYAAMVAAAYAKDLLSRIIPNKVQAEKKLSQVLLDVQDTVHEIGQTIASKWQDDKIATWLRAPDPSTSHNLAKQSRHEGTGSWLLRDPRYEKWKNKRGSFLWISGISGCGKTVLSSTLIEDVRTTCTSACLAYFYFDFNDHGKRTVDALLRSIIRQCCFNSERTTPCLQALWNTCNDGRQQPTSGQLYDCLVSLLTNSDQTLLVLDALDESMTRGGSHLECILQLIKQLRQDAKEHAHILVTSRAEEDIEQSFAWASSDDRIVLNSSISYHDIQSYIEHQLRPGGRFDRWQARPDLLHKVQATLMDQADGMFRWVTCQLDSLARCFDPESLVRAIASLPRGLDETYQRMIRDIPEVSKPKAITVLRLLVYSERPLTVDELVDALAVDLRNSPKFDPSFRMPRPKEVTLYCPSLVTSTCERKIRKAKTKKPTFRDQIVVRFAHSSVKEYLTSDRLEAYFQQQMEESTSRASLATICVSYLSHIDRNMSKSEIKKAYPFARYSARAWLDHAASRRLGDKVADDLILSFLLLNGAAYRNWYRLFDADIFFRQSWGGSRENKSPPQGLYFASLYGLVFDVEALSSHPVGVDQRGGQYDYALVAAAGRGHAKVVKLLIAQGASVDLEGPYKRTALHFATLGGHEDVIRLLLDAKANVNTSDVWNRSILGDACGSGNIKLVRLLVEHGAMMDDVNGQMPSALEAACSAGHEGLVQMLLSWGADVDGLGSDSWTPLCSAASKGYSRIITTLIRHGAKITSPLSSRGSPLYRASEAGHEEAIRRLLEAGAHVDGKEANLEKSPLYIAVENGHVGVIQILLAAGADPNLRTRVNFLGRGATPFEDACRQGREDIFQLMIDQDRSIYTAKGLIESALVGTIDSAPRYCDPYSGKWKIVRRLLQEFEVCGDEHEPLKSRALVAVCISGQHEIAQILLAKGADVNSEDCLDTALQAAISAEETKILRLLLDNGADVERVGKNEAFYRRSKVSHSPLLRAYGKKDWHVMKMLLDKGADLYRLAGNYNENDSVLEIACLQNNIPAIRFFLHRGLDLSLGLAPACFEGHIELIHLLTANGVDVNISNPKYGDPLAAASFGGHVTVVRFLLERGAKCDVFVPVYGSALVAASSKGQGEVVRVLLSQGADPNLRVDRTKHSNVQETGTVSQRYAYWWNVVRHGNALQAASTRGEEDIVHLLIKAGADVNLTGGEHGTALGAACYSGHKRIVEILLESGAEVNTLGGNALSKAVSREREDIIKLLVANGADANSTNETSQSAFLAAIKRGRTPIVRIMLEESVTTVVPQAEALVAAIGTGKDDLIQLIHDRIGDLSAESSSKALKAAAAAGKKDLVRAFLNREADPTTKGNHFRDALTAASAHGNEEVVQIILDHGAVRCARLSSQATSDDTYGLEIYVDALKAAMEQGHVGIVQALLKRDAEAVVRSGKHADLVETVLSSCEQQRVPPYRRSGRFGGKDEEATYMHKVRDKFDSILQMLLEVCFDVPWTQEDYDLLLLRSCSLGLESIVRILIGRGANVNARGITIKTPRHSALEPDQVRQESALTKTIRGGHLNITWILIANGAEIAECELNSDKNGKRLIHYAAEAGQADTIRRCLAAKANINDRDCYGQTALHHAAISGHHEIISLLLDAGATPSNDRWNNTPLDYTRGIASHMRGKNSRRHPLCSKLLTQWGKEAP